jgi:hypothetical protein
MGRCLVIPDIHHNVTAVDGVLAREQYDRVVFLGDYFDDFNDTPERARNTAQWLKQRLRDPRFTFLYGNHDLPYRFSAPGVECAGFDLDKWQAILDVLDRDDWDLFRLHAWVDGYLLSHAGWNHTFTDGRGRITRESIDSWCAECLEELDEGRMHPLAAASPARGGSAAAGGIVWQDWRELQPIVGLRQVVGHTPGIEVRYKTAEDAFAACLDTRLCHVGLIEGGAFTAVTTPLWDKWFGPSGRFKIDLS